MPMPVNCGIALPAATCEEWGMFEFAALPYQDKNKFYDSLTREIEAMVEPTWFTNLANASAAIFAHLPRLNWAGFYLADGEQLILGPFQGLPACLRIPFSKGVCGKAAREKVSVLVDDVHAFPGHIACDARSQSELVVPLVLDGRLLGVLDLDSPDLARFDEADRKGVEESAKMIVRRTKWPAKFV